MSEKTLATKFVTRVFAAAASLTILLGPFAASTQKSESYNQKCQGNNPGDQFNACLYDLLGQDLTKRNRGRQALDAIQAAIKLNPAAPQYYVDRAEANMVFGSYQDAVDDFTKAISMYESQGIKQQVQAHTERAWAFATLRQFDKAEKDFGSAIELDGKNSHTFYLRGLFYFEQGHFDAAAADFGRSIGLGEDGAPVYAYRGAALAGVAETLATELGNNTDQRVLDKINLAQNDLDHAATLKPTHVIALLISDANFVLDGIIISPAPPERSSPSLQRLENEEIEPV